MSHEARVSYYIDRYGIFHRILGKVEHNSPKLLLENRVNRKIGSTWLRLIVMFWNARVLRAAFKFGVAAVVMNQYERLGFAVLLLCFAL